MPVHNVNSTLCTSWHRFGMGANMGGRGRKHHNCVITRADGQLTRLKELLKMSKGVAAHTMEWLG